MQLIAEANDVVVAIPIDLLREHRVAGRRWIGIHVDAIGVHKGSPVEMTAVEGAAVGLIAALVIEWVAELDVSPITDHSTVDRARSGPQHHRLISIPAVAAIPEVNATDSVRFDHPIVGTIPDPRVAPSAAYATATVVRHHDSVTSAGQRTVDVVAAAAAVT